MGHHKSIYSVESKRQPSGYCFETEQYSECQLIYVTEGQLCFHGQEADAEAVLSPHGVVLLRPGGAFRLRCRDGGYRGFAVFMKGDVPRALRGEAVIGLADGAVRMLGGMIDRHVRAPVAESGEVLPGLARALVWEVLALVRERKRASVPDWADAVRTALEVNLGTALPVREVLASLPLSYRQLGRCFRDRYDTSPKVYQELLRIDEARRMLTATALDITCIATELGYSSSQHFASQFRRIAGCTPTAYRREPAATAIAEAVDEGA
jgi:AraC-like DNA-binding protein